MPLALDALHAMACCFPGCSPGVTFKRIPRTNLQTESNLPIDSAIYKRELLLFPSRGVTCEAWLYLPKNTGGQLPPVVIQAHGMGGQKEFGLHKYSEQFVQAGIACFVFDYRNFGGSDGEPRNWVSPSRHVQDWHSAIKYVREELKDRVDVSRMGLWGTSFGGGHALTVASQTPEIKAVVSQVPHLDARAATKASIKRRGLWQSFKQLVAGVTDIIRTSLGLSPAYLPLVGPVGSLAFMQLNAQETEQYFAKHPTVYQGGWQNLARACLAFELFTSKYSPIKYVPSIQAPILFVAATQDHLCPYDLVVKASKLAVNGRLLSRECTHFELYRGGLFERLIQEQVEFLQQHLLTKGDSVPSVVVQVGG